jgi:CrcB protein
MMYLWISLGSALGGAARYFLSGFIAESVGETFPWGTLIVNVTGSFAIGLFASLTSPDGRWLVSPAFRQFFMLGICGGYTTFSSFSLQTLNLVRQDEWLKVGGNVLLSVALCLGGVWLGDVAGLALGGRKG